MGSQISLGWSTGANFFFKVPKRGGNIFFKGPKLCQNFFLKKGECSLFGSGVPRRGQFFAQDNRGARIFCHMKRGVKIDSFLSLADFD